MNTSSLRERARVSDIKGAISVDSKRLLNLLLRFIDRGVGCAINYDIGVSRASYLHDLIVVRNIDLRRHWRHYLKLQIRGTRTKLIAKLSRAAKKKDLHAITLSTV
jgi:ribosomal protein S13